MRKPTPTSLPGSLSRMRTIRAVQWTSEATLPETSLGILSFSSTWVPIQRIGRPHENAAL
jgi:hypothetical protein